MLLAKVPFCSSTRANRCAALVPSKWYINGNIRSNCIVFLQLYNLSPVTMASWELLISFLLLPTLFTGSIALLNYIKKLQNSVAFPRIRRGRKIRLVCIVATLSEHTEWKMWRVTDIGGTRPNKTVASVPRPFSYELWTEVTGSDARAQRILVRLVVFQIKSTNSVRLSSLVKLFPFWRC